MPNPLLSTAHVLTVAATGASGALFTRALLLALEADERVKTVNFIASDNALRVFAEELAIKGRNNLIPQLSGTKARKTQQQSNDDIGGNVASGSYPTHAMIVIPCSMGTLARIAHGLAGNLIDRAADVCLKERRKLILMVRETPLHLGHLKSMLTLTEMGAIILPPVPGFYHKPQSVLDVVDHSVDRVLDLLGLPAEDAQRWDGGNAISGAESKTTKPGIRKSK